MTLLNSGIYKILNLVNGKFYIGSAVNFTVRFNTHRKLLNKGAHKNKHLQAAYTKHGADNFEFHILEYCDLDKLLEREQFYFYETDCCNNEIGYNLYAVAGSPLGTKWSDERKLSMSEKAKNRKHTEECKARMKSYQSNRPKEHNEAISEGKMGQFVAEETKLKIGKANRKPDKWPHENGFNCRCRECKDKKNEINKRRRRVTFTMVNINV